MHPLWAIPPVVAAIAAALLVRWCSTFALRTRRLATTLGSTAELESRLQALRSQAHAAPWSREGRGATNGHPQDLHT